MKFFYLLYLWIATIVFCLALSGVSCDSKEDGAQEILDLSVNELSFSSEESSLAIDITSNTGWTVSCDDADQTWFQYTPPSGNGNSTITVSVSKNDTEAERTATITVRGDTKSETVTLKQKSNADIYYENIGDVSVAGTMLCCNFNGWSPKGTGAAGVTYSERGLLVVGMSAESSGYEKASGSNNIFFTDTNQEFVVENIGISNVTNLTLSFGISNSDMAGKFEPVPGSALELYGSLDGVDYMALEYSNDSEASWVSARSEFKVPNGATKLFLKFSSPYEAKKIRIDDIVLKSGGNGTTELEYSVFRFGKISAIPYAIMSGEQTAVTLSIPYAGSLGGGHDVSIKQGSTQIASGNVSFGRGEGIASLSFNYTPSAAGTASLDVYVGDIKAGSVDIFVAAKLVYYESFSATHDHTYEPASVVSYSVSAYTDFLKFNQPGVTYYNEPAAAGNSTTYQMINAGQSLYPPSKETNGKEYYTGASGSFNVRFGVSTTQLQIFEIRGLDTSELQNMLMTFGLYIWNKDIDFIPGNRFVVNASTDQGSTWTVLDYETLNNGGEWTLARVTSAIPQSNNLYVRFIPITLAFRVDDIVIYGY